jgi:hypothetical protein
MIFALGAGWFARAHWNPPSANESSGIDCAAEQRKLKDLTIKLSTAQVEIDALRKLVSKAAADKISSKLAAALGEAKPASTPGRVLKQQTKPTFCTPEVSNNAKWRVTRTKMFSSGEGVGFGGFGEGQGHWKQDILPTYFCDKLHYNIEPWIKPKLAAEDVVMGIFTGESLFYGRTTAVRDTWLLHFPHHYIFSAHSEERIPVIGLADKYGKEFPQFGADYNSGHPCPLLLSFSISSHPIARAHFFPGMNAQWAQLLGLKEMYDRSPNQKWYYILGCDNYVHPDYVLRMLEGYDATKPHFLAQYAATEKMPTNVDISQWPEYKNAKHLFSAKSYDWTSGGMGWFMSNPVAKAYAAEIGRFMKLVSVVVLGCRVSW